MLAADGSAERRSAHCGVDMGPASGSEAGSIWNMNNDHTFNWSSVLRTESRNTDAWVNFSLQRYLQQ